MVIWKGINFKDKGIVVEKTPEISKGKKRISMYEVQGRDGFLTIDNGTYEGFSVSVECHIREGVNLDIVKSFLDGYGTLSFDGEREYTAVINNAIPISKVLRFKSFLVQFQVNPIAHDITFTDVNCDTSPFILDIKDATAKMYPIIKITGTDDIKITINNNSFYLKNIEGTYTLDCENKTIIQNDANMAHKMLGDFPYFNPGDNNIEWIGNIESFEISYKKAYL